MEKLNQPTRQELLAKGLTDAEIDLQVIDRRSDELGTSMTPGLAEAIARSELIDEEKTGLRRVPEFIFVRDILPAISGQLGNVSMVWWVHQFGATQRGFLVVDPKNNVIFEHPPMAPTAEVDNSKYQDPIGGSLMKYRTSVHLNEQKADMDLKKSLRQNIASRGFSGYIFNIAQVERICRRYGESILKGAKPEFVEVINGAVEGIDEAWGPLGKLGETIEQPKQSALPSPGNAYDDDDEQACEGTFD